MVEVTNNHHSKSLSQIFKELNSSEKGLTTERYKRVLAERGLNVISEKKKKPLIFKFFKQFHSPLVYILIFATIISILINHLVDAIVIFVVVIINAIVGFFQERKAEKAINLLKTMIVSYAKVYRDGELIKVPSSQIVPGDVIFLEEGDKVPADARLIEINNLKTQEASLTGESFPQEKNIKILPESTSITDRTNMVFMGTMVVSGEAKAIVVFTANKTQIGQVAKSIQEIVQPKTHFSKKVAQLSMQMGVVAVIGALLTFIIGFFIRGMAFIDMFLFTVASLVSGIPEGLPAVLIIVLAIGARRMAKRKAIIRHLPAVETLGVATIIATDKTGTLTKNSITVQKIITSEGEFEVSGDGWEPIGKFYQKNKELNPLSFPILKRLLGSSALCNKGNLLIKEDGKYEIVGDPTEVSLLVLAKKAGLKKENMPEKVLDDLPFNSEFKFRATLVENKSGKKSLISVGAFEAILKRSSYYLDKDKKITLTDKDKKILLTKAVNLAKQGMRILAFSYRDVPRGTTSVSEKLVGGMIFLGLIGMKDPPRKEVKEAVQKAKNAGIRIIMQTGDHRETAIAIAKEIGLDMGKIPAFTEEELRKMNETEFKNAVRDSNIFARMTPKMKIKIVEVLQEQGEIVAMTGDGVNDALALKKADIGISMGVIGTDVARDSSEIVLADDNFSSIVNAIEEGRVVFQNIRQTSFYLVTTNVAEDVTIISSLSLGLPLPMLPIQLLYLNLVTDAFTGISLAMEPGHHDVLNEPPRKKEEKILNKELVFFLLLMAGLMAVGTIPLFNNFLHQGVDKARTIAFVSMSFFQFFNVFNMRSLHKSIFKIKILSNKWVIYALSASVIALLCVLYIPFLARVFEFVPLSFKEMGLVILISSSVLVFGEIYKFFKYKDKPNGKN
ncbi:MAG TPA: HAD-IC family P-type ATPase [Candidatus Pacearchaeota archaeon]|nr:HAD-IC family P-type ATPase [Candidatus Pacearchaeota archaeon]